MVSNQPRVGARDGGDGFLNSGARGNRVTPGLVSVVIPAYNYADFIGPCIDSVLVGQNVAFEIVVVDDGSTDDTAAVVATYGDKVRYLRQDNAGLSAARNTGIRESRGEYLTFLDADDLLGPAALDGRVASLRANPGAGLAVCRTRVFGDAGAAPVNVRSSWPLFRHDLRVHLCRLNLAPPHAWMATRAAVEQIDGFDVAMKGCEDYDYWLRACGAGFEPVSAVRGEVRYRVHGSSMGAAKARRRAFPFDVLVHEKKAAGAYGAGLAATLESPGGQLALVDGMLHTAGLIDPAQNPQGRASLVRLAAACLSRLAAELPPRHAELDRAARLYLERVATRAPVIAALDDSALATAWGEVMDRYPWWRRAGSNLVAAFPPTIFDRAALASATLRSRGAARRTHDRLR